MAKINILKARQPETLKNGFHTDGGNLFLRVRGDSRVWIFRYKKAGKQISFGLGALQARGTANAREIAGLMRAAIVDGQNPADVLKAKFDPTAKTFKDYAQELIEAKRPSWRNAKHAQQWGNTLENYAYPKIGHKSPAEITIEDMKAILKPIWNTKTETASRVRMRVEAVLDYAIVHDGNDRRNPARWKGNLDKLLPAPNKITKDRHFAAAHYVDVPQIMTALRERNCLSAYCLRFIILTAARSGEARGALWDEINLSKRIWTISADRMKAGRDHVVPLCDEAVEILLEMQKWRLKEAERIFQGGRGGLLSDVAVSKMLHSIIPDVTVHGFRSSFRVWGAETTTTPSAVLELALAHVNQNKVEAAYQRSDLFDRRRELMAIWGDYCCKENNLMQFKQEKVA